MYTYNTHRQPEWEREMEWKKKWTASAETTEKKATTIVITQRLLEDFSFIKWGKSETVMTVLREK